MFDDRIKVIEKTGCKEWTGAVRKRQTCVQIMMRVSGKRVDVRREIYSGSFGLIDNQLSVSMVCGNDLCLNEDHMTLIARNSSPDVCGICGGEKTKYRGSTRCIPCVKNARTAANGYKNKPLTDIQMQRKTEWARGQRKKKIEMLQRQLMGLDSGLSQREILEMKPKALRLAIEKIIGDAA